MYCPNCAQENKASQKFCRKCGFNLEKTVASLAEQMPEAVSRRGVRGLDRYGQIVFGGLGIVGIIAVGAIIYTILTRFVLNGGNVFAGVLLILFLIFALLGLVFVILNERDKDRPRFASEDLSEPDLLAMPDASRLEAGDFHPIPSVVEETTDLLPVEAKTKEF